MKLNHLLTPYTKVNLNCTTDLNLKAETQENTEHFHNLDLGNGFLDTTPTPQAMKEEIDTLDLIQIKTFWATNVTITYVKRQVTEREKNIYKSYI